MFALLCATAVPAFAGSQDYNLKLGPFEFDAVGRAGIEFDTNIATSERDEESDVILFAGVDLRSMWEITEYNDLNINIGAYYRKYFDNSELDSHNNFLTLTPDTDISFRAIVGNLSVQVYDRLRFSIDGTDIITPGGDTNVDEYARFTNEVGANLDWDLNAAQLTLGLGRRDIFPLEDRFDYTRRVQYFVAPSVRKTFSEKIVAGVGAEWASTDYPDRDFQNKSGTFSIGPFINYTFSDNLDFSAGISYQFGDFDLPSLNPNLNDNRDFNNDLSSYSWFIEARHIASENYTHIFAFRRSIDLGVISNFVTSEIFEYSFIYSGFRRSNIEGGVFWGTGQDSNFNNGLRGSLGEDYDRYGFKIGLGYALSRKLTFDAGYSYTGKDSEVFDRSYDRSVLSLSLAYDF